MKSENTNGAKVSRFDVREEYARIESERIIKQPPINPEFAGGVYVVAVGETTPPEPLTVFIAPDGREVFNAQRARAFYTYGDALRWAVDNCEFSQMDFCAVPRGFEKPRFPRVCYLRTYTELTAL